MLSFDEQLERERVADEDAARKMLQRYADAATSGNLDGLPRAKVLIGRLFADTLSSVKQLQDGLTGINLRNRNWANWLLRVDAEILTVLLLRRTLKAGLLADNVCREMLTFQRLAMGLGRDVEREALLADATKVNPVYVQRAFDSLKQANTVAENHIQRTTDAIVVNVLQIETARQLEDVELLHIGKHLLQITIDNGLLEINHSTGAKGRMVSYHLSAEVLEFMKAKDRDVLALTDPSSLTMLAPPIPWDNITGGGYYSPRRRATLPLLLLNAQQYRKGLHKQYTMDRMPQVYNACNYLQGQALVIDPDVLAVVARVWASGGGVLGLPKLSNGPQPEFPFGDGWDKANASEEELSVFTSWKRSVSKYHTEARKNTSRVITLTSLLGRAKELVGRPIWCPVFLDWRGRVYYRGVPNPQGVDFEKAMLQFAQKTKLGKRGIYWLKVHIANSLGYDKVDFDARVAYVDAGWDRLAREADTPEDSDIYRGADNPFSAMAAVMELRRAYASGNPENYESGFIVHMDATCSGLQHFSAMLRDPVGAKYVNLSDTGKRQDIYQEVADRVSAKLQSLSAGSGDDALYANLWLGIGITRKLAKKPVMTYVYSATVQGATDDLFAHLEDIGWHKPGISKFGLARFLAKLLFKAIEDVVPAAAEAMRWLQQVAKRAAKSGSMVWVTPTGFAVSQAYHKTEQRRIKVRSCGIVDAVYYKSTDQLNPVNMASGIAPNFVHSLDASHLVKTVNACAADSLPIVTIHDSFGTCASQVDTLLKHTKEQFVDLYSNPNLLLESFKSHILIREDNSADSITIGNFNIHNVLTSKFFFS